MRVEAGFGVFRIVELFRFGFRCCGFGGLEVGSFMGFRFYFVG